MQVAIQHYQASYREEKLTEVSAAQLEEILHRVALETGSALKDVEVQLLSAAPQLSARS